MKVALSATGNNLDAALDPRFGRAACFLIVDLHLDAVEAVDNSSQVNAAHGAGLQAVQLIVNHDVDLVITGNVSPKAYQALNQAGIKIITGATGSCRECLHNYKSNVYSLTAGPTHQSKQRWK